MSSTRHPRPKGAWAALYCLTEGAGQPVKIGISARTKERLARMQGETWRELSIMWTVPAEIHHERQAHAALVCQHIRGEWFADPDDVVKSMVAPNAPTLVSMLQREFGTEGVSVRASMPLQTNPLASPECKPLALRGAR